MTDYETLFNDLVLAQIELWNAVDAAVRSENGVTVAQYQGMRAIASTEGCRVADIADALAITIGGASKLTDRIEASGYCVRRDNPIDRRSSLLELTGDGVRVLALASVSVAEVTSARLGAALTIDQREHFSAICSTLRGDASRQAAS